MVRRDIDFNLYELFQAENLCDLPVFKEYNRKVFDLIVSEARNFAIKEMLPTYEDGDKIGVSFDAGTVKVPESFRRVYKLYCESEWTAPPAPQEYGGQGRSLIEQYIFYETIWARRAPFPVLTLHSVAPTIMKFGSPEQKQEFLPRILRGDLEFARAELDHHVAFPDDLEHSLGFLGFVAPGPQRAAHLPGDEWFGLGKLHPAGGDDVLFRKRGGTVHC